MSNSEDTESVPKIPPHPPPVPDELSETSSSSLVILPTPSMTSESDHTSLDDGSKAGSSQDQTEAPKADTTTKVDTETMTVPPPPPPDPVSGGNKSSEAVEKPKTAKKTTSSSKPSKKRKSKRQADCSSTSESSDADSESEQSTDAEKEKEKEKRERKRKTAAKRKAAKKKAAKDKAASAKAKKRRNKQSSRKEDLSDSSSSDESDDSSSAGSEQGSDSDSDGAKKRKSRRKTAKAGAKSKSKKNSKRHDTSSDSESDTSTSSSDSSSSDSDSDFVITKSKRDGARAKRKVKKTLDDDPTVSDGPVTITTTDGSAPPAPGDDIDTQVSKVSKILQNLKLQQLAASAVAGTTPPKPKTPAKKNAHEFKRVDQVWDTKLRDYKLIQSTADQKDEFECVFTVRRRFNWEGKLRDTLVDIKSKALRGVLQVVLKDCKCVSLVEEKPEIDPHILYHYYDEITKYMKKTLKSKLKRAKRSKDKKQLTQEIAQCKLLLGYVDEDFTATRKALKPLLKAGTITYELCWALFKPNTIVFTPTYGNKEDPRCFKVEQCYEYESWLSGAKSCCIDGKYLEYDGQVYGLGDHQAEIKAFKGHKKITSLVAYPLKYHKDPKVRSHLSDSLLLSLTVRIGHS
jgi:hypothetical protein